MARSVSTRRIQKELEKFESQPIGGIEVQPSREDSNRWTVVIHGAAGTIYAGETYRLLIKFPPSYPIEAPEVIFAPPAPVHPHIYSNGHICLSILYDEWSPALTVQGVCLSILSMMSSCERKQLPEDNAQYLLRGVKNPKHTAWAFHDDTV